MSEAEHQDFDHILAFYRSRQAECPPGVGLRLDKGKYLNLQFKLPGTNTRSSRSCGESFTYPGIENALIKTHKVAEALSQFELASEFWEWYEKAILGRNTIEDDLKTYRQIFKEIEADFWNSTNHQTKRKRSRHLPNDVKTYEGYYGRCFDKFSNWDSYPTWKEIKKVLFSWKQGTKSFRDAYFVCKKISAKSHNSKLILNHLAGINPEQTERAARQSISLQQFLEWYQTAYDEIPNLAQENHREARRRWLWVTAMCVLYGLRPSEISAGLNLTKPYTKDGVTIPAINDPNNNTLLLVLGDFTYFGASIKTGGRVCKSVTTSESLIAQLHIKEGNLPIYNPKPTSEAKTIICGFNICHRNRLKNYKCPVTQVYAFRHLYNQLGEMYGVPQEIRARSMGHSVAMNDSVYKRRDNLQTTVDILTNHSRLPLPLRAVEDELERQGVDLGHEMVKLVLGVVYPDLS